MHAPSSRRQHPLVERLPHQGVDKAHARPIRHRLHHACRDRLLQHLREAVLIPRAHRRPNGERHLVADHRRDCEQSLGLLIKAEQPPIYHLQHRHRQPYLVKVPDTPCALGTTEHIFLFERPE